MPIKHKKTATFVDQPGVEINKGEWNDDHTNPDIADVTGLQAELDSKYSAANPPPSSGSSFSTIEINLGSAPRRDGKFTITGLSGLTIGKPVNIFQAVGPYTGKGTLADEAEMDGLSVRGVVASATEITAYWNAATRVRDNFKFNYLVGA